MLRFRLYSTITPGYQLITFLLRAHPLNISLLSREFRIETLFRFSMRLIIQHVFYAIIFGMLPTHKKKKKERERRGQEMSGTRLRLLFFFIFEMNR